MPAAVPGFTETIIVEGVVPNEGVNANQLSGGASTPSMTKPSSVMLAWPLASFASRSTAATPSSAVAVPCSRRARPDDLHLARDCRRADLLPDRDVCRSSRESRIRHRQVDGNGLGRIRRTGSTAEKMIMHCLEPTPAAVAFARTFTVLGVVPVWR